MEGWAEKVLDSINNENLIAVETSKDVSVQKSNHTHASEEHNTESGKEHSNEEHNTKMMEGISMIIIIMIMIHMYGLIQ